MESRVYLYKLLSEGLSYPEPEGWELIQEMFQHGDLVLEGALLETLRDVYEYCSNSKTTLEELQSGYLSFFDMGGVVSPYESEYVREKISRKPRILADVAGFYKAFGFEVQDLAEHKEVLDHISVELEFMALLYLKKIRALEENHPDKAEIVDDAIKNFLKDHLAGWGLFYCSLIGESDGPIFYKKISSVLASLLQEEVKLFGFDLEALQRGLVRPDARRSNKEGFSCGPMVGS